MQILSQSIFLARTGEVWKLVQRCCNVLMALLWFIAKWSQAVAEAGHYSSIVGADVSWSHGGLQKCGHMQGSFFSTHHTIFPSFFFL